MAEQTFKSPGFFEREVDLTQREQEISGIPAGVVGTSEMGPAFVPVTVGSINDFIARFGNLDSEKFGPYAVREFLRNRTAVTYVRVLGAGANASTTDFNNTETKGIVKNAGFFISGSENLVGRDQGFTFYLAATHEVNGLETAGYPVFTDNRTFSLSTGTDVNLIRGMIFCASGSRIEALDWNASYAIGGTTTDGVKIKSYDGTESEGTFKLAISSSAGSNFANSDGFAGVKIYTASFDPTSKYYVGKLLNKDPRRFSEEQHLLYGEFPVESEIAKAKYSVSIDTVAVMSGSRNTSNSSGDTAMTFAEAFGRLDTRYRSARTTPFISQPFGDTEYDLFHFETITDGSAGNSKYKISIADLKKSTNVKSPFGSFTVQIRRFDDTDTNPQILELYPNCTLDPKDENYIAKKIGDFKVYYDFDAEIESERKLRVSGKYPNKSAYVRVIMNEELENSNNIPKEAIPFGFRGLATIKTTDSLTDNLLDVLPGIGSTGNDRIAGVFDSDSYVSASVLPPVPMRFKVTRNATNESPTFAGQPGKLELSDSRYYWGIKFERAPLTSSISNAVLNVNASSAPNPLLSNYSKLLGIDKLDVVVTGSGADRFNDNKFTLARVALYNQIAAGANLDTTLLAEVTASADAHMLEAAYLRDKDPVAPNYYVVDDSGGSDINRLTMASLYASTTNTYFNRFFNYLKFTNMMYGGFDGVNILDSDMKKLNDRSTSSDSGGKAVSGDNSRINMPSTYTPGLATENNSVVAYRTGGKILTDELASRVNIITIPGIRDSFVTDYVSERTRDYSKAIYLMDIPGYDDSINRLFEDSTARPNVRVTSEQFDSRAIDNNYVATYFPDVIINDEDNNRAVSVPATVVALGALGFNDSVAYPWFAPAGFNRGALENVLNTKVRLTTADRDTLYEAKINPIANFPNGGFVIFGQKTLQQAQSALDRVNVRRMLLEVKRIVSDVALKIVFEQNTPSTRARFVSQVTPLLATIQSQQGIDQFKVVMDSSNNTQLDVEENRLNGRIVLVPTRAVEFIAIDFIVTNAGVSFE